MNSQQTASYRPSNSAVTKRRAVARAMMRGTGYGVLFASVMIAVWGFRFITIWRPGSGELNADRLLPLILAIVICGAIPPLLFTLAAMLSPRPRDVSNPFDTELEEPRSYSNRLRHFLGDAVASESPEQSLPRSRMAFFLTFLPQRRTSPKSAGYIREVLWRIRRMVRGSS